MQSGLIPQQAPPIPVSEQQPTIAFVSSARYPQPLDPTTEKKFRALSRLGDVSVIGFSGRGGPRTFRAHARFYLLPAPRWALPRYVLFFALAPIVALVLVFRYDVEVLIAQSPYEGVAAAVVKRIARLFGRRVRLVVESHGDFEKSVFLQRRIVLPRLYRALMDRAVSFALESADALRAVSVSTKTQLEQRVRGTPIVQFPTWTDIDQFLSNNTETPDDGVQRVLYAGLLVPRKGVHHLLAAFHRLAGDFPLARLVIVGRDENKRYADGLREQAVELGLAERVDFVGEVSQRELGEWMRRACVFVLPTYSEGLPRVVFEAMATGRPVIATAVDGIVEIVEDGVTGCLVPPGDEAALTGRLRWVLQHRRDASLMGDRGRRATAHLFSSGTYLDGYRAVLREALGAPTAE